MTSELPLKSLNDGNAVTLITPEGATRPVLGTARPDEQDKRLKVLRQWGQTIVSPRALRLGTIDEPLPQRSQTILSYAVDETLRERLNGGAGALVRSRRDPGEGR